MKNCISRTRFTLVELLCVCGILILLMGIGIGVYSVANRKMGESKCRAMIASMSTALQNYYSKHGYYIQQVTAGAFYIDAYGDSSTQPNLNAEIPISDNQVKTVTTVPGNRGYWKDPFGNAFNYQCPGKRNPTSFDLHSPGADQSGTIASPGADDITNWTQ